MDELFDVSNASNAGGQIPNGMESSPADLTLTGTKGGAPVYMKAYMPTEVRAILELAPAVFEFNYIDQLKIDCPTNGHLYKTLSDYQDHLFLNDFAAAAALFPALNCKDAQKYLNNLKSTR